MTDAWDDDWIEKADSKASHGSAPSAAKLSKAERRAKQAEFNRQLWEDAEKPEDNYFLRTRGVVPLKEEFKPVVKVLSRKPPPASASSATLVGNNLQQLNLDASARARIGTQDDDDDDDADPKSTLSPEERKEKAQREREEKQKAYEDRRRELFGDDSRSASTAGPSSSPMQSRRQSRNPNTHRQAGSASASNSRPTSAASGHVGQLYDPMDTNTKPASMRPPRRETNQSPAEMQPIRTPRAPDGSGKAGAGFVRRMQPPVPNS